ncbi:hypothetical protein SAMD00019534_066670 [Acytostelium subglobosum LB1]|uniref:hypothetical protein n=1 Tax=Acytostelium subglobosum LB1 TaxID=1410327 RepID=UPI000644BF2B|nr:hypothetical protein SAMD00019534_066670 [Acytostelium subglobosum LB1]GAM23492.1 hypothetical protein SAMD00019534_066670 [Acytostelium subglobosum LB1]|eukprot:XP_012753233.1 hypothetical protein SAMD00019534_066670 [Acytostelium subglobosum LB1]
MAEQQGNLEKVAHAPIPCVPMTILQYHNLEQRKTGAGEFVGLFMNETSEKKVELIEVVGFILTENPQYKENTSTKSDATHRSVTLQISDGTDRLFAYFTDSLEMEYPFKPNHYYHFIGRVRPPTTFDKEGKMIESRSAIYVQSFREITDFNEITYHFSRCMTNFLRSNFPALVMDEIRLICQNKTINNKTMRLLEQGNHSREDIE